VVIERVTPEIEGGRFAIKRVSGETVVVQADIFADGHDELNASLLYRREKDEKWQETPMRFLTNDRWEGNFTAGEIGLYFYTVKGSVDHFRTWQRNLMKRLEAKQAVGIELLAGAEHVEKAAKSAPAGAKEKMNGLAQIIKNEKALDKAITAASDPELTSLMGLYSIKKWMITQYPELPVRVDRKKAVCSAWYELFPRSWSPEPGKHGTLRDVCRLLPEIARMGFDVIYLPPIHPIGRTKRKGKNNSPTPEPGAPGSPWAIGAVEGGHREVHPELGTADDLVFLVQEAEKYKIEIALDLALQCSWEHPYIQKHPEWFQWRPDGSLQYAENPPKKYEDIIPLHFENESWTPLWEEIKSVVRYWAGKGIRIFRVDNPHTKPFSFWEWLIAEVKRDYPDVLFLAEAFTRPKIMYRLAKLGFSQSYTYFTWRNHKKEFIEYLQELTQTGVREFFRPNFWPNTPDILAGPLQGGQRPAFIMRLVLAATLSSNFGIYGPAFELCVNDPFPGKEEYNNNEKYELKRWDWNKPGNLKDLIARVNHVRRENPALQATNNIRFLDIENANILAYIKTTSDPLNRMLVVVNLDPYHIQSGWVRVPLAELRLDPNRSYQVQDCLNNKAYTWKGETNFVELNPWISPAHIFKVVQ
jgi:starch synthase (maltosyl-transferring)